MQLFDSAELSKARERLLNGDVVAIPTETVYGLAASIASEAGLHKIFSLKERPFFDPLIVHVSSLKQAASVAREWTPLADFLGRMFWPGPFTLVVPKALNVNPLITSGLDTVAIRYPSHPIAQDLISLTGIPLAAPSANKFGRTSPTSAAHVRSEFSGSDLLILDGGECEHGIESTVVTIDESGPKSTVTILRPGVVTEEMIRSTLEKWGKPVEVLRAESQASPGHLKHHYMPKIPLVILPPAGLSDQLAKKAAESLNIKTFRKPEELKLGSDAALAARHLYSEMRRLADGGADLLFVRAPEEARDTSGIWQAVWDRLTRAASLDLAELEGKLPVSR